MQQGLERGVGDGETARLQGAGGVGGVAGGSNAPTDRAGAGSASGPSESVEQAGERAVRERALRARDGSAGFSLKDLGVGRRTGAFVERAQTLSREGRLALVAQGIPGRV